MKKSLFIALVISVVAVLWVLSGVVGDKNKPVEPSSSSSSSAQANIEGEVSEPDAIEDKIPEVRVRNLVAQEMDDTVEVTGRTQASRQVIIRSEAEGQIASLNVKKGDVVVKGQILARLAVRDRAARVDEAKQLLKQRQIQYNASKELAEKGFNSRVRLAEKEAELKSARAQVKQKQDELSRIVIKAPFGGIINNQMVELGDYVTRGGEVFEIVDLNPIEISGHLTEKQIDSLNEGDMASALLLNGRSVEGQVTFIASAADINTRTFVLEITVANEDQSIREGLTAKILVPFKEPKAYKVSPSVLSLSDNGSVGVKLVNRNNIVEFKAVRLLKDTPDYLWISGLPDQIQLITVGQEFVISGQTVKPIEAQNNKTGQNLL